MKIIAEVGSNWKTKDDCLISIREAKACGADAVKFQLYDDFSFYYTATRTEGSLNQDWLPELKQQADDIDIEFMCSAFSPKLLTIIDPFVKTHKLASSEMCHVEMLALLGAFKKPTIVSTGGHHLAEIEKTVARLKADLWPHQITLMYCIANYPARHTDMRKLNLLHAAFPYAVGLSDHSLEVYSVPKLAKDYGATVLEKHVNFVGLESPDSPHSLSGADFKNMVKYLNNEKEIERGCDPEEIDMLKRHHRRLIARLDIEAGEVFKYDYNFGIYRSTQDDLRGFNPFRRDEVSGQIAKRKIKAGDSIGPGDF